MVDRDTDNSRMKDFFDVYYLLKDHYIDKELLGEAIHNTFENRGTHYHNKLQLFTPEFAKDQLRNMRWNSFLRKIRWKETVSFETIMDSIRKNLECYYH